MKKLSIVILSLLLVIPAFAQEGPTVSQEKNVLKVNTLSVIIGAGSIFYERKINNFSSAQLGVCYLNYDLKDTKFTGLILTPEFRMYVRKNAIDGFYIAPYFRYQRFSLEAKDNLNSKGTLTGMGGGLLFGRQWITNSGFTMDLFFGGHYTSTDVKVDSGQDSFNTNIFKGFRTRIGFALGFAF